MTPTAFLATLSRLGLSQSGAATLLGVSRGAVTRWAQGTRAIPGPAVRLLRAMDERPADLRAWLLALD